ncbi:hypothetical protein PV682_06365 [Streptomyces niveiscabiei]|uniref:hypothetical protein n=1 Tax=Streptomyces niveiscabiei TaxID=164115 RepID=UPI0029B3514A|nr:hypothetical protein [Streptomyces niveiscabiei]MDX3381075.1 hypothetical protein [Streptomyces niveiscabiei]
MAKVEQANQGVHLTRFEGYTSPLPPIPAAHHPNWPHQYARWLEDSPNTPLHPSRWHLHARTAFPPYVWRAPDLVRTWPAAHLDWSARGWHGIVPLRPLSPPNAPRVKAYRKRVREGALPPVLLWWVTAFDGWLLLDGHDRAVAALEEGGTPPCVVLVRVPDEEDWRRDAAEMTESHGRENQGDLTPRPHRDAHLAHALAALPYDVARTRSWPLPGGAAAWDREAARAVFQFPGD